jgi:MATE family multidrug resistance protein
MTDLTLPSSPRAWHSRVWHLSWPIIVANITIPLVGLVDTAVMGRMPEPAYLGAVAVGATIFNAIYWIFGFLRMGTTGLVAQALGAGHKGEVLAVGVRSLALALLIGTMTVAAQIPLHALVLWLFDASPQVEKLAGTYFLIRIWGAPALMIYMVVLGTLFGTQRVRATLLLSILLNVTNILLDILFVLGFGWGVAGVATATIISEWLAATAGLLLVIRYHKADLTVLREIKVWQRDKVEKLFHIGGNLIVRSFFVQLPFFVFTVIGASLGDLVLAANAIIMQLFLAIAFALDGPAHTAETLCGYAYGANNRQGLRDATRYTLIWAVGLAVLLALCFALFGENFVNWLTVLPEVRAAAIELLPWVVALPLAAVWAFHFDGVFIGTTQTATLRNCMFAAACVYLAVIWLGLEPLGNTILWVAMLVFMGIRGAMLAILYPRIERQIT